MASWLREVANRCEVILAYVGSVEPHVQFEVNFRDGTHYTIRDFYDLEIMWQIFFHHVYDVRPTDQVDHRRQS